MTPPRSRGSSGGVSLHPGQRAVNRLDDEDAAQPTATQARPDIDIEDLDVGDDASFGEEERLRPQARGGAKSPKATTGAQ
jgi:hypothetical protein